MVVGAVGRNSVEYGRISKRVEAFNFFNEFSKGFNVTGSGIRFRDYSDTYGNLKLELN